MLTFEQIKAAIPHLSVSQRDELLKCIKDLDDDDWDRQMERDAEAGKFDQIFKQIDEDIKHGRLMEGP